MWPCILQDSCVEIALLTVFWCLQMAVGTRRAALCTASRQRAGTARITQARGIRSRAAARRGQMLHGRAVWGGWGQGALLPVVMRERDQKPALALLFHAPGLGRWALGARGLPGTLQSSGAFAGCKARPSRLSAPLPPSSCYVWPKGFSACVFLLCACTSLRAVCLRPRSLRSRW